VMVGRIAIGEVEDTKDSEAKPVAAILGSS